MVGLQPENDALTWIFDWGDIRGEVAALGGMLGPVWFKFASGEEVQPFAVAPWANDQPEKLKLLPPILRRLRGEWPCVPFGGPVTRTDLPPRWMEGIDSSAQTSDSFDHGFSSNHHWQLIGNGDNSIIIAINYPSSHPVRRLERTVARGVGLAIDISLKIEMRRDADLPIGLHPVFALPDLVGAAQLEIPSLKHVRSFPVEVETGRSILVPDQVAASLRDLNTLDGGRLNVSTLPLPVETEELLMVAVKTGEAQLTNREIGYQTRLQWDAEVFPQCLLWISNRGRSDYPWNARFNAIGIEPVAAAFDLGDVHSANPISPLAKSTFKTSIHLEANSEFVTRYQIEVNKISV